MRLAVFVVSAWLLGALLSYWWGRVLLPEVGLTASGYWTWFFSLVPVMIGATVAQVVKEVLA